MTGRPDYDAGDLIVCTHLKPSSVRGPVPIVVGKVYQAQEVLRAVSGWGVRLRGYDYPAGIRGHYAECFRKIDPKPPEFWTGGIEVETREGVDA